MMMPARHGARSAGDNLRVWPALMATALACSAAAGQSQRLFWQQSEGYVAQPPEGACMTFVGYPVREVSAFVQEVELRRQCALADGEAGGAMSSVAVVRLDCSVQRFALLQEARFAGPFWSGTLLGITEPLSLMWRPALPPHVPKGLCSGAQMGD